MQSDTAPRVPAPADITPYPIPERFAPKRRSIVRAMGNLPHRYRRYRALTQIGSVVVLALVPLFGVARVDLLGDAHFSWFERTTLFGGAIAVGIAIFAFYFFTFQINLFAGRMFCGWGCPIGQLNRLTDTFVAQNKKKARLYWGAILGVFALALCAAVGTWWTAPSALVDPSRAALAWLGLALFTAASVGFARIFGWSFCRKACPIGLYYSVVQQRRPLGILYERDKCQDEGACVRACPVALDPRDLAAQKRDIGGFAIDGLAQNNHCLRCGACVEACEIVTSKAGPPALSFGRPEAPHRATADLVQLPARRVLAPLPLVVAEPSAPEEDQTTKPAAMFAMTAIFLAIIGAAIAYAVFRTPVAAKKDTPAIAVPETQVDAPVGLGHLEGTTIARAFVTLDAPSARARKRRTVEVIVEHRKHDRAVYVVTTKDRLAPQNRDSELHTLHISDDTKSVRNVPLPTGQAARPFAAPRPGTYRLYCDAHADETATLVVVDHPFIEEADGEGRFALNDIPAGTRTLQVFAADGTRLERDIEIVADETVRLTLERGRQESNTR